MTIEDRFSWEPRILKHPPRWDNPSQDRCKDRRTYQDRKRNKKEQPRKQDWRVRIVSVNGDIDKVFASMKEAACVLGIGYENLKAAAYKDRLCCGKYKVIKGDQIDKY